MMMWECEGDRCVICVCVCVQCVYVREERMGDGFVDDNDDGRL